jgi:hypothetical protein
MDTYITNKLNMHKVNKQTLYNTACKVVITLTILVFTFSNVEGNDLYCVSLKKSFKISRKYHYSIMGFNFHVENAEIYNLLHKPLGWHFDVHNYKGYSGGFGGVVPVFAGGVRLKFFYDDFVVIKKKPGIKLNKIKLSLDLQTYENPIEDTKETAALDYDLDKTYDFTNKHLDIHRCKKRQY